MRKQRLTFRVSFRLDGRNGQLLEEQAKAGQTTPSELARRYVDERLNRHEDAQLAALNFLAGAVEQLREQVEASERKIREELKREVQEAREVSARNLTRLEKRLKDER